MKINLWLTAFAALLWPAIEAVAVNPVKLSPKLAQNHGNTDIAEPLVQKTNETKPSASFDSFRVSNPEQNGDGTLILDSYHDNQHRPHHGHHHGHHYPHYSGTGEDSYHHRYPHYYDHHNNYGHDHHNHHNHRHLPSDEAEIDEIANNNGDVTEITEPVNNGGYDEVTDSVADNESALAVNGELVDDPETKEQPETTTDEPSEDVEEIPIEDVPGEPVNGQVVSSDLRNSKHYNNDYDRRYYDPSLSSYDRHHPIFSHLPPAHFKCSHVKHSGYSDIEAHCQVIWPNYSLGKLEILHFLHKSSPQKSNAVLYLDHGDHHHSRSYNHHHQPHYYHSRHNHHSYHHRHHYNGHHYPGFNYIKRKK